MKTITEVGLLSERAARPLVILSDTVLFKLVEDDFVVASSHAGRVSNSLRVCYMCEEPGCFIGPLGTVLPGLRTAGSAK